MNRQLYRVVFNRSRGQLMAVQETASSVGGGASGARDGAGRPAGAGEAAGGGNGGAMRFGVLAWHLVCAFGLAVIQPLAWSQAQPKLSAVASSTAPSGQRPIMDAAGNGVPIVHIAPPSAAGVSRNQYQQFNVDANGLILNNSPGNVQTQLGGWIGGNPQLGYVPARLIVNEVVGSGNSVLRGTIEVAGRRADVVIANPNGLLCDGCNFLNAGRATLSTGAPQYDAQGGLTGFDVRRGQLTVGAGGLNASNLEQLDLIARGLVLEGEVWAKNLQVLAGSNQVLYATLQVTPQDGTGSAPTFAVDIKDLGGMYAKQIYLVATERGLGVNSTGRIAALQGNLQLSANGDLTLKDSYAAQGMALDSSGTTTLTGQTQALLPAQTPDDGNQPADIRINAANGLVQRGTIDAAGRVTITALTLDHSGTTIQRGDAQAMTLDIGGEARNTGTLYSAGDLEFSAGQITDTGGRLLAQGRMGLTAQGVLGISATGTSIATGGSLQIKAPAGTLQASQTSFNVGGSLVAAAQGDVANVQGLWQSAQDVTLSAARIANLDSTVLASGALAVSSAGQVDNTGGKLLGGESVTINTGRFINDNSVANQSLVASDHATTITATQGVSNRGGILSAKTVLAVDAQGRIMDNNGGLLVSDATLDLRAGEVTNRGGQIVSRGQRDTALGIQAASLDNSGGLIDAGARAQVGISGAVDNSAGRLQSGTAANASAGAGTMQVDAVRVVNDGGSIVSRDALGLRTGELANDRGLVASTAAEVALQSTATSNVAGLISAATDAGIKTRALDNTSGQVSAGRMVAIDTQGGALNNASGSVQAGDSASIAAGEVGNTAGAQIVAGRSVQVSATRLDNAGGTVSAAITAIDVGAGSLVNQDGFIIGSDRLTLRAGLTSNRGGVVSTNAALSIDTQGADFDNTRGTVQAGGELSVAAANVTNVQGRLSSAAATRISGTGVLDNTGGEIGAARTSLAGSSGDVSIDTRGQRLANDGGRVVAEGSLVLNAGAASNTAGGSLAGNGDASLTVDRLDTSGGTVLAGNELNIESRSDVRNDGGSIAANGRLALAVQGNASNRAGTVQAGGALALSAAGLDNTGGQLLAGAALNMSTGTLVNDRGDIAAQAVTASAGAVSNKAGSIGSRGQLTLDAGANALANEGGRIVAQGALKLTAGELTNGSTGQGSAGLISTNQDAVVKVAGLVNGDGMLQSVGSLQFDAPGAVSNAGGSILAGGDLRLNAASVTNANAANATSSAGQGVIASGGTLDLTAGSAVNNSALIQGSGDVHVAAPTISNDGGRIASGQSITLAAGQLGNRSGEIAADGAISATAASVRNDLGRIAAGAALTIQSAGALDNVAGTLAGSAALMLNSGSLGNDAGRIVSGGALTLSSGDATNTGGGVIAAATDATLGVRSLDTSGGTVQAGQDLKLDVQASVTSAGGRIVASRDLGVTASGFSQSALAVTSAGRDASISVAGTLANHGMSNIVAGGQLVLGAATIDNDVGAIGANGHLDITASGVASNRGGMVQGAGALNLSATSVDNGSGLIASGDALAIRSTSLSNRDGSISAGAALGVGTGSLDNRGGSITGDGSINVDAKSLDNTRGLINAALQASLNVDASGAFINDQGQVMAQTLAIKAGAGSNRAGVIGSRGSLTLDTQGQALDNTGGAVQAVQAATITAGALINDAGTIAAGQDATVKVASLANGSGTLQASGDVVLEAAAAIGNAGGSVQAGRDLTIKAGSLSNANGASQGEVTAGRQLDIDTSGAVTNGGLMQSVGATHVAAQTLSNDGGQLLSGDVLTLDSRGAASNIGGTIASNGALTVNAQGLDNSRGSVSSNAHVGLQLASAALGNAGGVVSAAQGLTVASGAVDNRGGRIVGGSIDATTQGVVNDAGVIAAQASVRLDTQGQALSNDAGLVVAEGVLTLKSGAVSNLAGALAGNGGAALSVDRLDTSGGAVQSGQDLTIEARSDVASAGGSIVAARDVQIAAARMTQSAAATTAAGGNATLSIAGTLANNGGSAVTAQGRLVAEATAVDNDGGSLAANGQLDLTTADGASNRGGQIVSALGSTLTTGPLDNTAGTIASGGAQRIDTQGQALKNTAGTVQAAAGMTLTTGALGNQGGVVAAGAALTLNAAGAIDNSAGGQVATGDTLTVHAGGQSLTNEGGRIVAQKQLELTAGAVSNAGLIAGNEGVSLMLASFANGNGTLQAGTDLQLTVAGAVSNTGGILQATRDLSLNAASLSNVNGAGGATQGVISAGHLLAVSTSASVRNSALVQGAGDTSVTAQTITNDGGQLLSGGALTLSAGGAASNVGGTLGANGPLDLASQGLDNTRGQVNANAAVKLQLAGAALTNDHGSIESITALTLDSGSVDNRSGKIVGDTVSATTLDVANEAGVIGAQAKLTLNTQGRTLGNAGGAVFAGGALDLASGKLDNTQGGVVAANGNASLTTGVLDNTAGSISGATLGINASGVLTNAGGRITSSGATSLNAAGVASNELGRITAGTTLVVDAGTGSLNNAGGTLAANGAVGVKSGALDNSAGVIASVGSTLAIDTQGQALGNDAGRVQAAGNLMLRAGDTSNRGGLVSGKNVDLAAGTLDNSLAGAIVAEASLTASTHAVKNDTGLIQAGGDLTLDTNGQALVNTNSGSTGGLISGGAIEIKAGSVDNRAGAIASTGSQTLAVTGDLDNRSGGQIASRASVNVTAARVLNSGGQISAGLDLNVTANTLDNASGLLEAGRDATVRASSFANAGGRVVGDRSVTVSTDSSSFGGSVTSVGDVALNISGDYTNTGTLSAQNSLTLNAANIGNSGVLSAGSALAATATGNITNSGEISATTTQLAAGGTISNSGLIDGGDTRIDAGTLNNTGRIYGDRIGVKASAASNSGSGVIAARESLDIGVTTLANTAGGLIYSLGGIAIGGSLAADGSALGSASSVLNASSTIESRGGLSIASASILNRNDGLVTATISGAPTREQLVQPRGSTTKYPISLCSGIGGGQDDNSCIVHPDVYGLRSTVTPVYTVTPGLCNVDSGCAPDTTQINYSYDSPMFARFGVTPVGRAQPAEPGGGGACTTVESNVESGTSTSTPVNSPACNAWRTDMETWTAQYRASLDQLSAKIDAYNAEVNEDNRREHFEDYTLYDVTTTTSQTNVVSTAPGKILSGGDMVLQGAVTNRDSTIVAGGSLTVVGPDIHNEATQGTKTTSFSGTTQFSHVESCGFLGGDHCRDTDGAVAYNPPSVVGSFDLSTVTVLANASDPSSVHGTSGATTPTDATRAGAVPAPGGSTRGAGGSASIDAAGHSGTPGASGVGTVAAGAAPTQAGPSITADDTPAGNTALTPQHAGASRDVRLTDPAASHAVSVGGAAQAHDISVNAQGADGAATGVQAVSLADGRVAGTDAPAASAIDALKQGTPKATTGTTVGVAPPTVQRVAAVGSGERARDVVLTVVPRLQPPTSSLFTLHPEPGSRMLVETDPRFTQYRSFLGSDYVMQQLALDPERQLKRYGDGFYEQSLVNDQVLALTGRRYLTGYSSTEDEFKSLMDAGVAFAKAYQLTPGVALTAEQMAQLSTDIVWLTTQSVTLADGTTQQVLVPQVYIRRASDADLSVSGALMAGTDVLIKSSADLSNSGSILGDRVTLAADNDIVNRGHVRGADVLASAGRDLSNLGGSVQADGQITLLAGRDVVMQTTTQTSTNSQGSRTSIDRIAMVQGGDVRIDAGRDLVAAGALVNAGTDLIATAGRDLVATAVEGRYELHVATGGSLQGRTGYITEGSTTNQVSKFGAGSNVALAALGNLSAKGTDVQAGGDVFVKGVNVEIAAVKDKSLIDVQTVTKKEYDRAAKIDETLAGGTVKAGGNVTVVAGGDASLGANGQPLPSTASVGNLTLSGAQVSADKGQVALVAKNDLTVQAVTSEHRTINESYASSKNLVSKTTTATSRDSQLTQVEGSTISGNTVLVQAGDKASKSGDITIQGSNIRAEGAAVLDAGRDLNITTAEQSSSIGSSQWRVKEASGLGKAVGTALTVGAASAGLVSLEGAALLTKKSSTQQDQQNSTQAIGSSISAGSVSATGGRDVSVQGSAIVADRDIAIEAGRNLGITSAQDTQRSQGSASSKTSGFVGSLLQPAVGTVKQSQNNQSQDTTQAGSQVASLNGSVQLKAGEHYTQTASQVLAPQGDIDISARQVDIGTAQNDSGANQASQYSKTAIGGSVSVPLLNAVQGVANAVKGGKTTGDTRMQALAALDAGLQAKAAADAAQALAGGNLGGVKVSVSLGHSESRSQSAQSGSTAVGSTVAAGGRVGISAEGAGTDSTLNVKGSEISAGCEARLKAEGQIRLEAAQSTSTLQSTNSSSGASVGIGFAIGGQQNGFTLEASANKAQGRANGTDTSATNTHVTGDKVVLDSGADTTLKGAVVQGKQVTASVGGNLNIESVQDTSKYDAKQQSAGVGVSVCIPPFCYGSSSASASFSQAKAGGDYASVVEQSGIKAGDGGFQVTVKGDTQLKGGVITSTQAAIDAGKNSLTTKSITASDIQNKDDYKASGIGVSVSVSGQMGDQSSQAAQDRMSPADKDAAKNARTSTGLMPGVGQASGSQGSTTSSGISGAAIMLTGDGATVPEGLKRDVTTDKASSGSLKKAWDGQQLMEDVQAQVQITQSALPRLANEIGNYAATKTRPVEEAQAYVDVKARADKGEAGKTEQAWLARMESDGYSLDKAQATLSDPQAQQDYQNWKDGGAARVASHAVLGALGGGLQGALGAGASAAATPTLADAVNQLGLPEAVRQAVITATGVAVGAVAGGSAGAVTGGNEVANNYLKHDQVNAMMDRLRAAKSQAERDAILAEYDRLSQQQSQSVQGCTPDQCAKIAKDIAAGQQALNAVQGELKDLSGGFWALNGDRLNILEIQSKDKAKVETQQEFNAAALLRVNSQISNKVSPAIKAAIANSERCIDVACATDQYKQLSQLLASATGSDAIALTNEMDQLRGKASVMGGCIPGTLCESLVMVGNVVAGAAMLEASTMKPKTGLCSFRGDMQVKTISGFVAIQNLHPGDWVFAKNEFTGEADYRQVLAQYSNPYSETVYVSVEDENGRQQQIVSNRIHPFFVQLPSDVETAPSSEGHHYGGRVSRGAWVDAANLKPGFKLQGANGHWQHVTGVQVTQEAFKAFNLTVQDFHTYFIKAPAGEEAVWVHNNCWDKLPDGASATGKTTPDGRQLYTFKDANGDQVSAYQGTDGRWYDPKVYSPDAPTAIGAKAQPIPGAEKAIPNVDVYESIINGRGLSPSDKLAYKQETLRNVAEQNGWVEDKALTKANGRVVYRDPEDSSVFWSQDTQHGRFEKSSSDGSHLGEYKIDGSYVKNSQDKTGGHNLRIKL